MTVVNTVAGQAASEVHGLEEKMYSAMISADHVAAIGKAADGAIWISGWIIVLAIIIGVPVFFARRSRKRRASN
jgi:hypothetical protein